MDTVTYTPPLHYRNAKIQSLNGHRTKLKKISETVDTLFTLLNESNISSLAQAIFSHAASQEGPSLEILFTGHIASPGQVANRLLATKRPALQTCCYFLDLDVHEPAASSLITLLARELFKCETMIWNLSKMREAIAATGLNSGNLILILSHAQRLFGGELSRFMELLTFLMGGKRVIMVTNNLHSFSTLPLPKQFDLSVRNLQQDTIRTWKMDAMDIVNGILLEYNLIPDNKMIDFIFDHCKQARQTGGMDELKIGLKLALVEMYWKRTNLTLETSICLPSMQEHLLSEQGKRSGYLDLNQLSSCGAQMIGVFNELKIKQTELLQKFAHIWQVLFYLDEAKVIEGGLVSMLTLSESYSTHEDEIILRIPQKCIHAIRNKETLDPRNIQKLRSLLSASKGNPISVALHASLEINPTGYVDGPLQSALCTAIDEFNAEYKMTPLTELCFLELSPSTSKILNPRLIESVQKALESPQFYRDASDAGNDNTHSDTPMNDAVKDIGMAYKLSSECGKLINAMDWYTSYRLSIDPNRTLPESILTMRFQKAVLQLQLMGIIGNTKKKPDHYERLLVFTKRSVTSADPMAATVSIDGGAAMDEAEDHF